MSTAVSTKKSICSVRMMAKISLLAAIAVILMLMEIPLPFTPPFYKIDVSEIVVLIGGFALGIGPAIAIEGLKIILNLLFNGTDTAMVGELANFLIGCSFVLPAIWIYQKEKTRRHALYGLVTGTLAMVFIGALINYLVLLPAYSFFYGMPMEVIIGMGEAINPNANGLFSFVMLMTIPFNLTKGLIDSIVVFLIYKKVSPLLKK